MQQWRSRQQWCSRQRGGLSDDANLIFFSSCLGWAPLCVPFVFLLYDEDIEGLHTMRAPKSCILCELRRMPQDEGTKELHRMSALKCCTRRAALVTFLTVSTSTTLATPREGKQKVSDLKKEEKHVASGRSPSLTALLRHCCLPYTTM